MKCTDDYRNFPIVWTDRDGMDRHRFSWENASDLCNLNTGWSGEDKKNWISNTDRSRSNPLQCEACLSQSLKPTLSCAVPNTAIVHLDLFLPSVAIYIITACALVSCYCSQSLFHNPTVPPWLLSEPVAPSDLRFPPRPTHIIIPSILIPLRIVSRTKIIFQYY